MPAFPDGHFYSPVPDVADLRRRRREIWRGRSRLPGIDLRLAEQQELLQSMRPWGADFDYPESTEAEAAGIFYDKNPFFSGLDSRMFFCLLRRFRPRRIIEVGSGFTSLLAVDVNRRFLDGAAEITCIEPYPRAFLKRPNSGIAHLVESRVEDVGSDFFGRLEPGDFLFIDSSHVCKTGSDVNFLYFEVLPRLAPGLIVHVHDIFLPQEYPEDWVLGEERGWNEQYLLRAILMYSKAFEVLFGSACAYYLFPELVESVFGSPFGGGSFWMKKTL